LPLASGQAGGTEAFDCVRREFEEAKEKVISSLSVRKLMPVRHQGSSFRLQSKAELLSRLANAVIKIERFYTRDSGTYGQCELRQVCGRVPQETDASLDQRFLN
jgi:hypothetical protein